jgi:hypothetical protein
MVSLSQKLYVTAEFISVLSNLIQLLCMLVTKTQLIWSMIALLLDPFIVQNRWCVLVWPLWA